MRKQDGVGRLTLAVVVAMAFLTTTVYADKTHSLNKKANRLYEKGMFQEALKMYEDALLEAPGDEKLKMNKGSALYQLGNFEGAEQSFSGALSLKDEKARADLHYNLGNTLYRQGEKMMMSGGQGAQEKFKAALENYIKALDIRPNDRDAKWNVQLTQARLEQLKNQQQNQDKDQKKKDQQNKDNQNQDQQDKQDQQDQNQDKQNQQDKKDQNQQDQRDQSKDPNDQKKDQQPQPQPQDQSKEQQSKDQAKQLIEQFADDDDQLNKPRRIIRAVEGKKPEKNW